MEPANNLPEYYARRAGEYEKIYAKPERQPDLAGLRALLPSLFAGRDVLEVACGTGYWTQILSLSARSILATDINEEVLEIARNKVYPHRNVTFQLADAYTLATVTGRFSAGFAGFWWSHIPKRQLSRFLDCFNAKLGPGACAVFLDNNYVEGSSTPIVRRDSDGNSTNMKGNHVHSPYPELTGAFTHWRLFIARIDTGLADSAGVRDDKAAATRPNS